MALVLFFFGGLLNNSNWCICDTNLSLCVCLCFNYYFIGKSSPLLSTASVDFRSFSPYHHGHSLPLSKSLLIGLQGKLWLATLYIHTYSFD